MQSCFCFGQNKCHKFHKVSQRWEYVKSLYLGCSAVAKELVGWGFIFYNFLIPRRGCFLNSATPSLFNSATTFLGYVLKCLVLSKEAKREMPLAEKSEKACSTREIYIEKEVQPPSKIARSNSIKWIICEQDDFVFLRILHKFLGELQIKNFQSENFQSKMQSFGNSTKFVQSWNLPSSYAKLTQSRTSRHTNIESGFVW